MKNFVFNPSTELHVGDSAIQSINQLCSDYHRVLLLYGGGSAEKCGALNDAISGLGDKHVIRYSGIGSDPKIEQLQEVILLARTKRIDLILAIGGGSVIDAAKFIAICAHSAMSPYEMLTNPVVSHHVIPIGAIVTLPATGSENNRTAVISSSSLKIKKSISIDCMKPKFAILNPQYTMTLTQEQMSLAIVDTFLHILEQYLTHKTSDTNQERIAEGLLIGLIENSAKLQKPSANLDARANLMLTSALSMNGLLSAGMPSDWASHIISHELTALYNIPHPIAAAIIYVAMLKARRTSKADKLESFYLRVMGCQKTYDMAEQSITFITAFIESHGVNLSLKDCGVGKSSIKRVSANLEVTGILPIGDKKDIYKDEVTEIMRIAYNFKPSNKKRISKKGHAQVFSNSNQNIG